MGTNLEQYVQHLKRHKKQLETGKQSGRWQKIQGSKNREIELISKKV